MAIKGERIVSPPSEGPPRSKRRPEKAKIAMFASLLFAAATYGYLARANGWFPAPQIADAEAAYRDLRVMLGWQKPAYIMPVWNAEKAKAALSNPVVTTSPDAYPGVNIISGVDMSGVDDTSAIFVRLVDMGGKVLHEWKVSYDKIWPDPSHVAEADRPKRQVGTHIHGVILLESGDVVFNFDGLGLVRLDPCGKVVWRLAQLTHHSVHLDEDGTLWVPSKRNHRAYDSRFANHAPPFIESTLLQTSQDGEILREVSVLELLVRNGYAGLLYLSAIHKRHTVVSGDTMHLNDIELFPQSIAPGFFQPGDVMISLRNINTVLVFSLDNLQIKFIRIGEFIRQHDPDFLDGNTISLIDNRNIARDSDWQRNHEIARSRIVIVPAATDQPPVYLEFEDFYTSIGGKHQWLPNGNLLITSPRQGRAFEVNSQGSMVWEYINIVDAKHVGFMEEVRRYPVAMADTLVKRGAQCAR
jgi:hypothetical protein